MKTISIKQFFQISRPISFVFLLISFIVAILFSTNIFAVKLIHLIEITMLTLLLPFFVFSINDLYDYSTDKINLRKHSAWQGQFIKNLKDYKKSILITELIIFTVIVGYSLIFNNLVHTLLLVLLLFLGFFYSVKPIRFKEIPFLDSLSNGIIVFLTFASIFVLFNSLYSIPIAIIGVSISTLSYHLLAAEMDLVADKRSGQKTTATLLKSRLLIHLICIVYNIPLLFIHFNSVFKYLFYVNLIFIIYNYFSKDITKKQIFFLFTIIWVLVFLIYIFSKLF